MMRALRTLILAIGLAVLSAPAWAVLPNEMLADPVLEARARDLSAQLRCLVCQNESIDESGADLARDLRLLIRERISGGESNDQVRAFVVARYGNFILLQPPFNVETLLLWLSTPLILGLGGFAIYRSSKRKMSPTSVLTEEEERRLSQMTQGD